MLIRSILGPLWNHLKALVTVSGVFITLLLYIQIKSNPFYSHITTAHVPLVSEILESVLQRQCRINLQIDSTYLQTYTNENVQYTYTQYTQCTIRHTYNYQYTLYTIFTHYTLCTHIYIHTIICEGATDYT